MSSVDYIILIGYLVFLLILGAFFARKASNSSEEYFLGGHRIPWWALGSSGMASNLDVAGTMTVVTLLFVFGLHGFFIEMRGGVVLPIAVFLAFMGKWHQRSQVMTTAEWMLLRFGTGWQGRAARFTAALTYVVITIGMVVFFLGAAGKFLSVLLPLSSIQCQIILLVVAFIYTAASGIHGVVWTDVIQSVLILAAAAFVAFTAMGQVSPELLANWPGAEFNSFIPSLYDPALKEAGASIGVDYSLFGVLMMGWFSKGLLEGLGGSGGSAYMAQRFYAASKETDCPKIGMLWTVLFAVRWPMVLGFAILAVSLGIGQEDPERVLPQVLMSDYFPSGVRGLVLAALLAAAMSTFDSTINAGASYIVKDLYQPLIRSRECSERELVWAGYAASLLIVVVGLLIALQVESVVGIWVVIVINLFPAFLVPFALRWFWGRLNGAGFTAGVVTGFAMSAGIMLGWIPVEGEMHTLGWITGISLVASVVTSLVTEPSDVETARRFCQQIRPWGFWGKYRKDCASATETRGDLIRLAVALVWQISTFLLPMGIMLKMWNEVGISAVVWIITGVYLLRDIRKAEKAAN